MSTLNDFIERYSDGTRNSDGKLMIVIPKELAEDEDELDKTLKDLRNPYVSPTKKKKYKKDPNAPKKPTSAYMIWLNKNRSNIKDTYFGDYADITDWTLESKQKYYESKGLKEPTEEGKSRLVALIASKAGILWNCMSIEEKTPYDDLFKEAKETYETLKASYVPLEPVSEYKIPDGWNGPHFNMSIDKRIKDETGKIIKQYPSSEHDSFDKAMEKAISLGTECFGITQTKRGFTLRIGKMTTCSSSIASWTKNDFVNPIKTSRGRGRPKTNSKVEDYVGDDETADETANVESNSENEEELEVEPLIVDGTKYLYDEKTNDVYDPETSEYVGKYVDGSLCLV
jgi:hypothetical protein